MTIILCVIYVATFGVAFFAGVLWQMSRDEEKFTARVIRPAHITVNSKYHITEYVVADDKALEIDYPETNKAR